MHDACTAQRSSCQSPTDMPGSPFQKTTAAALCQRSRKIGGRQSIEFAEPHILQDRVRTTPLAQPCDLLSPAARLGCGAAVRGIIPDTPRPRRPLRGAERPSRVRLDACAGHTRSQSSAFSSAQGCTSVGLLALPRTARHPCTLEHCAPPLPPSRCWTARSRYKGSAPADNTSIATTKGHGQSKGSVPAGNAPAENMSIAGVCSAPRMISGAT